MSFSADESETLLEEAQIVKALKMNRKMQKQLLLAKQKIEKLRDSVNENINENKKILETYKYRKRKKGFGIRGAYLRGGTFYLKGNMFFKDADCRNCPNNPDYEQRKAANEMFPMDLELNGRHVWSLKDKEGVIEGIKEQIIEHLLGYGKAKEETTEKNQELNSVRLVKLLDMVGSRFYIDWNVVSKYNLQNRHSAKSCEAIWNVYLYPSLNRHKWTEKENLKLLTAAQEHNCQDWKAIAEEVGSRSDFQCFVQYQNYVCYLASAKSKKWTKEEDARLVEVIERNTTNGLINWSNVMVHFPHKPRTTLQCRYSYSLKPHINRDPFTPEEDILLLASVKEYGTKFSSFPRMLFPNRTTVQLRSRYRNTLVHRHKPKTWTLEDDLKLMDFVKHHGAKSWKKCEEYLGTRSRISCRTRYMVITNLLTKNPNAKIEDLPRKRQAEYSYVNTQNWTEKLTELSKNPDAKLVKKIRRTQKQRTERKVKCEGKKKEKVAKKSKEIKKDRPKVNRQKPMYMERLRANTLAMYNSFKYAYDAEVGQDPCKSLGGSSAKNLEIVKGALGFKYPKNVKPFRYDSNIPSYLRATINAVLRHNSQEYPNGFSLPTSWSTAVGFRALCIHSTRSDLDEMEEHTIDENNFALVLFRKRLRALFYTTALLSRLNPLKLDIPTTKRPRLELSIQEMEIDANPVS